MTPKQEPNERGRGAAGRASDIAAIVDLYQGLMRRHLSTGPAFLDAPITMAQAKVLFLIDLVGELHMSELAARLGISLSTVSGLVDRLVDHGLLSRREDPADRRLVVVAATVEGAALVDRFRQLGIGELRELLADLADGELEHVRRAFEALHHAVERVASRG